MIVADDINNTALYGFHPDFVREENNVTSTHDEDIEEAGYALNYTDSYLTGVLLTMAILFMAVMYLPIIF